MRPPYEQIAYTSDKQIRLHWVNFNLWKRLMKAVFKAGAEIDKLLLVTPKQTVYTLFRSDRYNFSSAIELLFGDVAQALK